MEDFPLLLLYFGAWSLVGWYAYVGRMIPHAVGLFVFLTLASICLPDGYGRAFMWSVLLLTAARSGWLLVQRQNQEATR